MRIVDYTSIALKDLRGQALRTSLTIFALIISSVVLVLMAAISTGGQQAITEQFGRDDNLTTITVVPNQSSDSLSPFGSVQEVNNNARKLDDSVSERLARLPYVASATARAHIWEFASFSVQGIDKQFVASSEGLPSDAKVALKAGRPFLSNDEKNSVILGYGYARELGYGENPYDLVGKTMQINTQQGYRGIEADIPPAVAAVSQIEQFNQTATVITATIIAVTDTGPDQNSLLVPLGWAHDIRTARYNESTGVKAVDQLDKDGYSAIRIRVNTKANVELAAKHIEELGYGQFSTLKQLQQLEQFAMTMWVILGAIAMIAVIASALGVVNTMLMSVSEQRYTIGVWRACGARKGFIMKVFLVEAGLLGLLGGMLGAGAGVIASRFINQYINTFLSSQNLAIADVAIVPMWLVASTIGLTTLFAVLAGLYPAYRASRLDPTIALNSGQ